MQLSVEITPQQKLDQTVLDQVSAVSVVHLPTQRLDKVIEGAVRINQQAGRNVAIPHVAARSVHSLDEIDNFTARCKIENIKKVLIIGGNPKYGKEFQSAVEVRHRINGMGMQLLCGVYPQTETAHDISEKLKDFSSGISQLYINPRQLAKLDQRVTLGIPSMCSASGLWRYMKLCGLTDSVGYAVGNWRAVGYLDKQGFNTAKFISHTGKDRNYHIYNFGNLLRTVENILNNT